MKNRSTQFLIILGVLLLVSCATAPYTQVSLDKASQQNFKSKTYPTHFFKLFGLERITQPGAPLVVYIEGDGHSMASKYKLSDDPTPHQPLALELALLDPRPNVMYIARPCQYLAKDPDPNCHAKYWSTHRYANEVIMSTSDVIETVAKHYAIDSIHLVGFSGGAGVGALVATMNPKIQSLTTVAGHLNTQLMDDIHQTTPQVGSLNPIDFAEKLTIPQRHFAGAQDKVVPIEVIQSFVEKANSKLSMTVLAQADHHKGWIEAWPELLKQNPA